MHDPVSAHLDAFDRKILALWQGNTRLPAKTIGDDVGLSAAAVQRRLKRLRDEGVIQAEVAQLDAAAMGLPVTCIVNVDLDRERSVDLERFRRRMLASAEVQQCYYVTGQSDFVLIVLAADMAAYEAFTHRVLLDDANVKSFVTHVVMSRVKASCLLAIG